MRFMDGEVSDILSLLAHAGAAPRNASSSAVPSQISSAKQYLHGVRVRLVRGALRVSELPSVKAPPCSMLGRSLLLRISAAVVAVTPVLA